MKKTLFALTLLLSLLLLLPTVSAQESDGFLSLSRNRTDYSAYSTATLKVSLTDGSLKPEDILFTWSVDNEAVAYVSGDTSGLGLTSVTLKTLKDGTATVTCEALCPDGASGEVQCRLKVGTGSNGHLSSITMSKSSLFTSAGSREYLFVTTDGDDDYDSDLAYYHWYSKDPDIADVESEGGYGVDSVHVTAKAKGTTSICCEASLNGGSTRLASCEITVSGGSAGSLSNFGRNIPWNDPFTDVSEGDWFYPYVKGAYQYGLMQGKGEGIFAPNDSFIAAEAIKVAACIHSIYHTGSPVPAAQVSPWYTPYVNYCMTNKFLHPGDFSDYNAPCTRSQMAGLFAACLPAEELAPLRSVTVPDCTEDTPNMEAVQLLYDAGVLSGDEAHAFHPKDSIRRSEVSKILCTLLTPSMRDETEF